MLFHHYNHPDLCFDAVIVDEGQDFTKEAWDVISLLHVEDGEFFVFCDPEQNIFNDELTLPDFGPLQIVLKKNCRNTRQIFEAMKPYGPHDAECSDASPDGVAVREFAGNCHEMLASELKRLTEEKHITADKIVILGAHAPNHTSIGESLNVGGFRIVSRSVAANEKNCIRYYTYMKFKGCESEVVILLDVDPADPRWANKMGLYTAMSKATHQLIVLHPVQK